LKQREKSPRIVQIAWGRMEIEGQERAIKDAKLYPGGVREWDWNETGTRHNPGIQPADVQELLDHGAKVVVFGKGFNQRLQVKPETLQMLEDQGIPAHELGTEQAVEFYNELREHSAVGALIHSTC
jgi:hypothetical protein